MDTLFDIAKVFYDQVWGQYSLAEGETGHWRIGPLHLWAKRLRYEWRLSTLFLEDPSDKTIGVRVPLEGERVVDEREKSRRFCVERTDEKIFLIPALADRPIVVRPEEEFCLPPKEETVLFINSVLWCRVFIGENHHKMIDLFPIYHLCDTWFGPSTVEGELCYGAKTAAKQRLESVKISPFRVITKVYIKNLADNSLVLEKIKIPITNLSLYYGESGLFFTESVVLQREKNGQNVRLSLGRTPKEGGRLLRLSEAQRPLESHFVSRAMHTLFGQETQNV